MLCVILMFSEALKNDCTIIHILSQLKDFKISSTIEKILYLIVQNEFVVTQTFDNNDIPGFSDSIRFSTKKNTTINYEQYIKSAAITLRFLTMFVGQLQKSEFLLRLFQCLVHSVHNKREICLLF